MLNFDSYRIVKVLRANNDPYRNFALWLTPPYYQICPKYKARTDKEHCT